MKTLLTVILLLFFISCKNENKENKPKNQNEPLKETLGEVLSILSNDFSYKDKILLHREFYPDNVKRIYTQKYLEFGKIDSVKVSLVQKLLISIDDSVKLDFHSKTYGSTKIYESSESNEIESKAVFGLISFSNVIFSKSGEKACYYLSINCGNECGAGFLVFSDRIGELWTVDEIIKIWGGGEMK